MGDRWQLERLVTSDGKACIGKEGRCCHGMLLASAAGGLIHTAARVLQTEWRAKALSNRALILGICHLARCPGTGAWPGTGACCAARGGKTAYPSKAPWYRCLAWYRCVLCGPRGIQ